MIIEEGGLKCFLWLIQISYFSIISINLLKLIELDLNLCKKKNSWNHFAETIIFDWYDNRLWPKGNGNLTDTSVYKYTNLHTYQAHFSIKFQKSLLNTVYRFAGAVRRELLKANVRFAKKRILRWKCACLFVFLMLCLSRYEALRFVSLAPQTGRRYIEGLYTCDISENPQQRNKHVLTIEITSTLEPYLSIFG